MPLLELCFACIISGLGIATNAGILIFSRMLGTSPKRKKYSFGGYSTEDTYSEHRSQKSGIIDAPTQRRVSEPASRVTTGGKKSMQLMPNTEFSLLRLSSLLSINRLDQEVYPASQRISKPSGKMTWRMQSRRHRIYLQGLLILAFSNLLISFILLASAIYALNVKEVNFASVVASLAILDAFQAVEVGALLWIAVNRAHAIHSTSRHSSRKTTASEATRPFTGPFQVTTEKQTSSCLGCWCCFCYCSRRVKNTVTSLALESVETQQPSRCLVVMRFQKVSRLCLCCLPFVVMIVAFCGSTWQWIKRPPEDKVTISVGASFYYTLSTSIGVFVGLFVMPTSFLLSTNCLIYRKVAKRHKRFLLRQTSNSSKTTFLIDEEPVSSPSLTKTDFASRQTRYPAQMSIPTFTITGSSDQDLNRPNEERSNHLWDLPETSHENLPPAESVTQIPAKPSPDYLEFLNVKASTNELSLTRATSAIDCSTAGKIVADVPKRKLACPDLGQGQRRRKSMSEFYSPVIVMANQPRSDHFTDSVFVRQLQRQHKRTVVVLASILIVFVVCHGPRAIWLCARWFSIDVGDHLLPFVTLWSRVCIFIDPVLYGFWGNRAYRRCLRNISSYFLPVCGERNRKCSF